MRRNSDKRKEASFKAAYIQQESMFPSLMKTSGNSETGSSLRRMNSGWNQMQIKMAGRVKVRATKAVQNRRTDLT